jgi:F-type H+-transporting ATPase subunit delta
VTSSRAEAYATAVAEIAAAEGQLDMVADQLYQLGRTMETSDDLRTVLIDRAVPVERRLGVVDDLLGGRAAPATIFLVDLIVAAERSDDLPEIADGVRRKAAEAKGKSVAEVRSAVPLDDDVRQRLADALSRATGRNVDVQVVVDPSVMGGIVAQIDDLVFDGSVAHRLDNLRSVV